MLLFGYAFGFDEDTYSNDLVRMNDICMSDVWLTMSDVWLTIGDLSGAPIEAMARAHVMKESFSNNFGEIIMKVMMMI